VTTKLRQGLIVTYCLWLAIGAWVVWQMHQSHRFARSVTSGYDWKIRLPPPPASGSSGDQADLAAVKSYQVQYGGVRWQQASRDVSFDVFQAYGPVLGIGFLKSERPEVADLFDYAQVQLGHASASSKATFLRPRPYVVDASVRFCTKDALHDTSYPSGHAGWGWLSARILAQIEPAKAEAIFARGRDYGLSRVVCGVHYPTDVLAGQRLGEIVFKALENDQKYQHLLEKARKPTAD
jgi:acid phosphatase (class A)